MESLGDKLYRRILISKNSLWLQGEMSELAFSAFNYYIEAIKASEHEKITVTYPIGLHVDETVMNGDITHSKKDLITRFEYLGHNDLPLNGLFRLVTTIETLMADLLKLVMEKFPLKIPGKKKIDYETILNCKTIEEAKFILIDTTLNELAYKSPKEFAQEFANLTGVNLLEHTSYHKYIELKATRDIHIHNNGVANEIYKIKADILRRAEVGTYLPVDVNYFLKCYETCIQICEYLEKSLHATWHSDLYVKYLEQRPTNEIEEAVAQTITDTTESTAKTSKKKKKLPDNKSDKESEI